MTIGLRWECSSDPNISFHRFQVLSGGHCPRRRSLHGTREHWRRGRSTDVNTQITGQPNRQPNPDPYTHKPWDLALTFLLEYNRYKPVRRRETGRRRKVKHRVWEGVGSDDEDTIVLPSSSPRCSSPLPPVIQVPSSQTQLPSPSVLWNPSSHTFPPDLLPPISSSPLTFSLATLSLPSSLPPPLPLHSSDLSSAQGSRYRCDAIAELYLKGWRGKHLEVEVQRREAAGRRKQGKRMDLPPVITVASSRAKARDGTGRSDVDPGTIPRQGVEPQVQVEGNPYSGLNDTGATSAGPLAFWVPCPPSWPTRIQQAPTVQTHIPAFPLHASMDEVDGLSAIPPSLGAPLPSTFTKPAESAVNGWEEYFDIYSSFL